MRPIRAPSKEVLLRSEEISRFGHGSLRRTIEPSPDGTMSNRLTDRQGRSPDMSTIAIDRPTTGLIRSTWQLVAVLAIALVFVIAAFLTGHSMSPTRTVRTVVNVPSSSTPVSTVDSCRLGRAC